MERWCILFCDDLCFLGEGIGKNGKGPTTCLIAVSRSRFTDVDENPHEWYETVYSFNNTSLF
jgi:hypothetical protein